MKCGRPSAERNYYEDRFVVAKRKGGIGTKAIEALKWGVPAFMLVAAGYAWRSYAPLPIPGDSPLSADQPRGAAGGGGASKDLANERRRAERAERELAKLRESLTATQRDALNSEAEMADSRVRDLLSGE
jgi:hypothetical protein